MNKRERPIEWDTELELVAQAASNVGDAFGAKSRTRVMMQALAREIRRLVRVREEQRILEFRRREKANAAAKKAGAELPYPADDIPF